MDYSEFSNFPFPQRTSPDEEKLKKYFFSQNSDAQLELLNGCKSYEDFKERLKKKAL